MRGQKHIRRSSIETLEQRVLLTGVFAVNTTADSGAGSLRDAINTANADANGVTVITFNLPGTGVRTIKPTSALPTITAQVDIQGTTDSAGNPLIEIDGTLAGASVSGLNFNRNTPNDTKPSEVSGLTIDRFSANGISIAGDAPTDIFGCRIGTDPTGVHAHPNAGDGVLVSSVSSQIGLAGRGAAFQTLISGNSGDGIDIDGADTIVQNCFIGTDLTGASARPNKLAGIEINVAFATIGGRRAHQGNVISGNSGSGIVVNFGNCDIVGNKIGVNSAGTAGLGNVQHGIIVSGTVNVSIGDSTNAGRNIISGNGLQGIDLFNDSGTDIDNNLIGTDIAAAQLIPNLNDVVTDNSSNERIADSVIGGGITGMFLPSLTNSTIDHCFIGIDPTLQHALANGTGIWLPGTACTGNSILNCTIADNTGDGIFINDDASIGNRITENSIFSNGSLGIALRDGTTPLVNNNIGADGPNDLLNYPVLTSANVFDGHTFINGRLDTTLINTFFTVEFFANDKADPSGFGEGQTFLGSTRVQTDGNGNGSFSNVSVNPATYGQVITATAIATPSGPQDGDTSEFSKAIPANGASVAGIVFNDLNGNGIQDSGETGLKGRTVYIDVSQDDVFDSNSDPFAITDAHGRYRIFGLAPDAYRVRLLGTAGWQQTTPSPKKNAFQTVIVTSQNETGGVLFGQEKSTATPAAPAVDAGSNSPYIDLSGQTFAADTQHPVEVVAFNVSGTDDDALYYSFFSGSKFNYNFTVPNGKYTLKLFFFDPDSVATGERTFDVTANGALILKHFDIFAAAGAAKKAVVTASSLTISNKTLALSFKGIVGDAIVSAIELVPA